MNDSDEEDDSDEADSSSDDELELMREYEKLKKEREEEQRRKEMAKVDEIKQRQKEEVLQGNPLLNSTLEEASNGTSGLYSLKRKWHEETVFKHQARNVPVAKVRFINDTVRSDFHRRFLSRTIQ